MNAKKHMAYSLSAAQWAAAFVFMRFCFFQQTNNCLLLIFFRCVWKFIGDRIFTGRRQHLLSARRLKRTKPECYPALALQAAALVVSRVMRKKVSRQRKKRVVMQWRNRREQPPGASCSCISCCPTECLRHGAGERRRALGRNCRQGRHPRPGCAYGSRG